jgi:hypothetical protein
MDCAVIYSEAALADLQQVTAFIAADNLFDNFLELRADDVHASIVVKVSPERDV